jgi:adenosylhomocysteinase
VYGRAHFERMKDGAVLANAGGLDTEIDVPALAEMAAERREVRRQITEYRMRDGRRLHLLAEGRLVNIAGADGHPVEIMDLSFTVQALAIHYLGSHRGELPPGVHPLPAEIDREIAAIKLETLGISIDSLTQEQEDIRGRWK